MPALTSLDRQRNRGMSEHSRVSNDAAPNSCEARRRRFGVTSVGVVAVVTRQHQCKIGFHEVTTEHQADVR